MDVPTTGSPRREPEPGHPVDPTTQAAADVRALLAGAAGLRRVVELAAENRAENRAEAAPADPLPVRGPRR